MGLVCVSNRIYRQFFHTTMLLINQLGITGMSTLHRRTEDSIPWSSDRESCTLCKSLPSEDRVTGWIMLNRVLLHNSTGVVRRRGYSRALSREYHWKTSHWHPSILYDSCATSCDGLAFNLGFLSTPLYNQGEYVERTIWSTCSYDASMPCRSIAYHICLVDRPWYNVERI